MASEFSIVAFYIKSFHSQYPEVTTTTTYDIVPPILDVDRRNQDYLLYPAWIPCHLA